MTLASRISAGFLVLVILLVGLGTYQLSLIDRLHAVNRHLTQAGLEAAGLSLSMRRRVEQLDEFSRKFLLLRDPGYTGELRRLRQEMEKDLTRLRDLDLAPEERSSAQRFGRLWRSYAAMAPQLEEEPAGAPIPADLSSRFGALRRELDRLLLASRKTMSRLIDISARRVEHARWIAWGTASSGLAAAVLLSLGIIRSVSDPLRRLTRGTHELTLGDLSYRVAVSGPPELSALARDFNTMAGRLDELDRLKKDFLMAVSHDLKAPLASMAETTRLLLDRIPGDLTEKQETLLRLNLKSGERLSSMIADLLDLARLEAGAVDFEREPLDLAELARETLDELESLVRSAGVRVSTSIPSTPVEIEGDGPRLTQVLTNLLSNAAKFTPQGGQMGVRVQPCASLEESARDGLHAPRRLPPPWVILEVWDSGPGVPEGDKEKIFERFHRGEAPGRGPQGTGLGLAIARHIATAHGGELWVEDRPGGGSRFVLALPPAQTVEAVAATRGSW